MSLDNFHLLPAAQQGLILNGPALSPPAGVIPDLVSPPNGNTLALAVSISCLCVSTMAFALGVYSKIRLMKNWRVEDFIAFAGYVIWPLLTTQYDTNKFFQALSIGFAYSSFSIVVGTGYFVHQWNIRVKDLSSILYAIHIGSDLYAALMMCLTAAILLEWKRIFVPRGTRGHLYWMCHALVWINVMFYASILIAGNSFCKPFAKLWDKTLPGTCRDGREAVDVASGSINLASHLVILVLAQRNIWRLHLRTKKKLGVALIFAVGIFACIAAGFRLAASVKLLHSPDATYHICNVALWCHVEITCAILVFYLPILPTVFRRWAPVIAATSSNCFSTNEAKSSNNPAWRTSSSQPPSDQRYGVPAVQSESTNADSWELTTYSRLPDHIRYPPAAILRTTDVTVVREHGSEENVFEMHRHNAWSQHYI
ncbi:hypothetical protein GGR53DRAFT_308827 [Hypoxylon sp. FL1150]|nr:hypothetical protein GGR53DRAFT_308827 [Hypoxylon sp. FL1150]